MAETILSYRDLRVWQIGVDLVEDVYRLTRTWPKYEQYGLISQIQRAAVSVPSNIAEGHTRVHKKEFLNHLSIAQASLAELETQLEIARRLGYIKKQDCDRILQITRALGKQLYALRNSLVRRQAS